VIAIPEIPPRVKKYLTWAGYPLFAIAVVMITIFATLPRDRIKDKIETALSAPEGIGMDVTVGDVGLMLFTGAGIKATDVVLRSRPMQQDVKPARYVIDDIKLRVGLLGLLFRHPTYRFKAHTMQGELRGAISASSSQEDITLEIEKLVLTGVQAIAQSVGLPVEGTLALKLEATAPQNLMSKTDGSLDVTLADAALGDGKAKLTVPGDPFMSQGLTFPRLKLGTITGHVTIEKGKAKLEDFRAHSADGDVTLDGFIELKDPLSTSQMHGYLRFKPSDALVKREPTVELMTNSMAAAKRPDGYLGIQLSGPIGAVFYLPNANPPPGVALKGAPPPSVPSAPLPGAHLPPPSVPQPTTPVPGGLAPPSPLPPPPPAPPAGPTGTTTGQPAAPPTAAPAEAEEPAAPSRMPHHENPPPPEGGEGVPEHDKPPPPPPEAQ
jgi:type II secretion system protein N